MTTQVTRIASKIMVLSLLAPLGCGDKSEPITPEEATAFVTAWAPTVENALAERSEGATVAPAIEAAIAKRADAEKAKTTRDEPPYDVIVQEVYVAHEYQPRFVRHGQLTAAGEAAWNEIQNVEDHALDVEQYHVETITKQLGELQAVAGEAQEGSLAPTEAEQAWAVQWVQKQNREEFPLTEASYIALTDALVASSEGDRLEGVLAENTELEKKLAAQSAELEALIARDWVKLARDLRHQHVRTMFIHPRHDDYYNDPEIRRANERPPDALGAYKGGVAWRKAARVAESMADHTRTIHQRLRASLESIISSEKPDEVAAATWPAHPQYRGLVEEHRRYRAIVEAGGWEKVPEKKKLRKGQSGSVVEKLKKRLQIEGYYPADGKIDKKFDDTLEAAIKAYQQTHQMEVDGVPGRSFWRSVNVPADRRLEQIRLNLQRWHRSNIRHDEDDIYVYVNVPAFMAEIWDDGEMKLDTRIVVGNNDWVEDAETGEKTRANRTPLPLAAYIDRAIYNPYWNVTPRVRTNEILPEVKAWMEARYEKWKRGGDLRMNVEEKTTGAATPSSETTLTSNTGAAPAAPSFLPYAEEPEVPERFKVYMDEETGEFDVSTTHPDHVPGWYAANNYEVMYPGKSWEYVRMTPGEHNSLGFVKVIFPNLHDVYLHDTNAKPLFKRPVRAFSHGCMRMAKPLEFAEYLLRRDKVYEENNVDEALEDGTYLPVFLERQVPVFVEYHTVGIDADGRANFYIDIYDYDEEGVVIPTTGHKKVVAP